MQQPHTTRSSQGIIHDGRAGHPRMSHRAHRVVGPYLKTQFDPQRLTLKQPFGLAIEINVRSR